MLIALAVLAHTFTYSLSSSSSSSHIHILIDHNCENGGERKSKIVEMRSSSADYTTTSTTPELIHVAQQSRRDKLRVSSSLNNNYDEFLHTTHFTPLVYSSSPEMLGYSGSYSSIHPTRFVPPSGSDFKVPFVESCVGGSYENYQNNLQNWGNLHTHPYFVADTNPNHGLSLSLSSNQICEIRRLGLKPLESGKNSLSSIVNQSVSGKCNLNPAQSFGPLGPFTGYATILKGSKFLKPAQQLLDEFLSVAGLKPPPPTTTATRRENSSGDLNTGGSNGHGGDGNDEYDQSYRPDCHEKKAKLINMQDEVCKRQKQYHQEIQIVMWAFELVPGIASATPYISRSLKTLSRHFKCLKNAIADQLRCIKNILGEDLSSPAASFSRGDHTSFRFCQNFARVKSSNFGGSDYQNNIWRPQRGLPERAVSILRAWLFDHFLHPYPTDTDKQMLATQTGLSRNQVSNWFINARVRLWKPMVEEIHMLESKGVSKNHTEPHSSDSGFSSIPIPKNNRVPDCGDQPDFQPKQLEQLESSAGPSSSMQMQGSMSTTEFKDASHQQITTTGMESDASFVGFMPNYQRRGLEREGIGMGAAISLTLGLRQGSETTHQFQQLGMHFGGHIYDSENGV